MIKIVAITIILLLCIKLAYIILIFAMKPFKIGVLGTHSSGKSLLLHQLIKLQDQWVEAPAQADIFESQLYDIAQYGQQSVNVIYYDHNKKDDPLSYVLYDALIYVCSMDDQGDIDRAVKELAQLRKNSKNQIIFLVLNKNDLVFQEQTILDIAYKQTKLMNLFIISASAKNNIGTDQIQGQLSKQLLKYELNGARELKCQEKISLRQIPTQPQNLSFSGGIFGACKAKH